MSVNFTTSFVSVCEHNSPTVSCLSLENTVVINKNMQDEYGACNGVTYRRETMPSLDYITFVNIFRMVCGMTEAALIQGTTCVRKEKKNYQQ